MDNIFENISIQMKMSKQFENAGMNTPGQW